jgi:hypothetical protein
VGFLRALLPTLSNLCSWHRHQCVSFLPLLEPLPWTGDNRCEAIVDAFLSDHNPSQNMGFNGLFVYDNAQDHTAGLNIGLFPQVGLQVAVAMDLAVGVTTP